MGLNLVTNTFNGTMSAAIAASGDFNSGTKVIITDADYTAANLKTINDITALPIVLLKTAASQALSDSAAIITAALDGITNYTGAIIVTDANTSAADLNTIAKSTTGKVTATLDVATTIDSTTVTALNGVKATDNITFVPTDDTVSGTSELTALINLKKLLPSADFSAVNTLEGTSADVAAIKSALNIATDAAVTIDTNTKISAVDANAIAKATDGALTATIKDGSVAATLKALANVDAADVITFTTTDTSVNARDLVALNAKVDTFTVTSITTITENAATVGVDAVNVITAIGIANVAVKITGTISATTADLIADATNGVVTATIAAGTASNLLAALGNAGPLDALTLTVNGGTAAAADLNDLDDLTSVAVNASAITEITATTVLSVTDLYAANAAKTVSGLGNEAIKITGDISAAEANTIAKLTTGVVTASVSSATADVLVAALTDAKATDALTLVVTGAAAAADLKALDGKTSVAVDASSVTLITGNAADVKTVLAASGIDTAANVPVTVSGTVSAVDANTITGATSGIVTAEVAAGTAAALNKALVNANGTPVTGDNLTLTISKGTAAAADLIALDAKTNVLVDATAVTTITGDFAAVNTVLVTNTATTDVAPNVAVTLSGTVSAANADIIAELTTGVVTATITADTAAILNGQTDTGGQVNAYTLTVNNAAGDAATAALLNSLDAKTSVKVKVDAAEVTGAYADLETLYVTNKAGFANLGNEAVTITGPSLASQVNTIAKATTGIVTAAVTATADVLVANLKDANATDKLTLVVNGASAKASDLNTLDGKTSEAIVVSAANVTGNIADVTKVFVTNKDNFTGEETKAVTISGTVTAAQADAIADVTAGAVTANIADGTAAALNTALVDFGGQENAYKLTVNGATAAATDLNALVLKTSEAIKVDAKEITGAQAQLAILFGANKDDFTGEETKAVKITDTVAAADVDVIADATSGVVTATIVAADANTLNTALVDAGKQVNAYTLTVNGATAAASDLKALDAKTSVTVNASAVTGITGSAADIKTVLAAKTITTAANVTATVDGVISAADANTISKATTGVVTATVDAGTASALKSALAGVSNDDNDALDLTVTGTTAAAADLIALDAKTSVVVEVNATTITGNIADVTKVLVTDAAHFTNLGDETVTISGTVSAVQADAIAEKTSGVVTATITADTAANLNAVADSGSQVNAYKLTVSNDTTTLATDLTALDAKTSVAVDAHLVTDISGTSAQVAAAYATPTTGITGLGNETVHITGNDATVANVAAINTATTGVITLDTLNTSLTGGNFSLSQLGDLKGITGLNTIDADNLAIDSMTISIKDLLASNDSANSFALAIIGDNAGSDTVSFTDIAGWTQAEVIADTQYTFTNNTNSQVITVNFTDVTLAV